MELNTHVNRKLGCPLSLHELQVNPLGRVTEVVGVGMDHRRTGSEIGDTLFWRR